MPESAPLDPPLPLLEPPPDELELVASDAPPESEPLELWAPELDPPCD